MCLFIQGGALWSKYGGHDWIEHYHLNDKQIIIFTALAFTANFVYNIECVLIIILLNYFGKTQKKHNEEMKQKRK